MADLPRLEPLPLPHLVSPSVPFLQVAASEAPGSTPTTVDFFGTHVDGTSSRVRLVFASGLWVRFSPSHSDREIVREADYDWSAVPRPYAGPGYVERERRWHEQWRTTGVCPDPGAYEVLGSPWLAEHGHSADHGQDAVDPYHHYLVLGHDAYVEVLATGWHADELDGLAGGAA